jgi:hypothetical protein
MVYAISPLRVMQSPTDSDGASTTSSESLETIKDYNYYGCWVCAISYDSEDYLLILEDDEWVIPQFLTLLK